MIASGIFILKVLAFLASCLVVAWVRTQSQTASQAAHSERAQAYQILNESRLPGRDRLDQQAALLIGELQAQRALRAAVRQWVWLILSILSMCLPILYFSWMIR